MSSEATTRLARNEYPRCPRCGSVYWVSCNWDHELSELTTPAPINPPASAPQPRPLTGLVDEIVALRPKDSFLCFDDMVSRLKKLAAALDELAAALKREEGGR